MAQDHTNSREVASSHAARLLALALVATVTSCHARKAVICPGGEPVYVQRDCESGFELVSRTPRLRASAALQTLQTTVEADVDLTAEVTALAEKMDQTTLRLRHAYVALCQSEQTYPCDASTRSQILELKQDLALRYEGVADQAEAATMHLEAGDEGARQQAREAIKQASDSLGETGQDEEVADRGEGKPPKRQSATGSYELVRIAPGSFTMGSSPADPERYDGELHARVTIDRPFLMGRYEVTQGQWASLMGENPTAHRDAGACARWGVDDALPVTCVSWCDAIRFANQLSTVEGLEQVYEVRVSEDRGCTARVDRVANGYRLPTEAEWEYAARAGAQARWGSTSEASRLCTVANVRDQTARPSGDFARYVDFAACEDGRIGLAPVGSYQANPWGLHDMIGNVAEWVEDDDHAREGVLLDVRGTFPVTKGGSFLDEPRWSRVAYRRGQASFWSGWQVGVRLARNAE